MDRPDPIEAAHDVVRERFPQALQAWLGGSAASGQVTDTSDLDVVVLIADGEVHRQSLSYRGWPVELFVETEAAVRHFLAKQQAMRRPTLARLVAQGVPLLADGRGQDVRRHCAAVLAAGPPALTDRELQAARYVLTDLIDDLVGGGSPAVIAAVACDTWRRAAELLLASERHWLGTGKWLMRELEDYDATANSHVATRFHGALAPAVTGEPQMLIALANDVLDGVGGRLREGLYQPAALPA